MAANTTQSTAYGYSTTAKVYRVRSPNGYTAWYVAATPGEAVDDYISRLSPVQLDPFQVEEISVIMCQSTDIITSGTDAGASSGVSATCAAWASTYSSSLAAGLSGANSSQGTQRLLSRNS